MPLRLLGGWGEVLYWLLSGAAISLVCLLAFYNGLENDFVFDDTLAITGNADTRADTPWPNLFENDIWGKNLLDEASHRSFRPLLVATFKVLTINFGQVPYYFRVSSMLFHVIASNLVYTLAAALYRNRYVALGSALLFASHPIHVESVTAVVNMAEAASCIFYILAYIVYVKSTERSQHPLILLVYLAIAFALTVVSVLFKETGVTISAIIISRAGVNVALSLVRSMRPVAPGHGHGRWRHFTECAWKEAPWLLFGGATVVSYFLFRIALVSTEQVLLTVRAIRALDFQKALMTISQSYLGESQLIRKAENPYAFLKGEERVLSLLHLHFRYAWLLLLPLEQCAEYAFDCIPKISSLADPRNYYTLAMYGSLIVAIAIGLYMLYRDSLIQIAPLTASQMAGDGDICGADDSSPAGAAPAAPSKASGAGMEDDALGAGPAALQSDDYVTISGVSSGSTEAEVVGSELDDEDIDSAANPSQLATNASVARGEAAMDAEAPGRGGTKGHLLRGFWLIDSRGLLLALSWIIVPFIPMSGFLLRLGTLLAERLLYVPSVGYCMLLALFLHQACGVVARGAALAIKSAGTFRKQSQMVSDTLTLCGFFGYLSLVFTIITLYVLRTRAYNMSWKDEVTLFTSALDVCPRSAKLNYQVSKIFINNGSYIKAQTYLDTARELDPDFCDIGYQYGLLNAMYLNDVETAINYFADNLKCIYSSKSSMDALNQIWAQQISLNPQNYRLLETQGDTACRGGLHALGGQKYFQASHMAFKHSDFESNIRLSEKAEKAVKRGINDTGFLPSWWDRRKANADDAFGKRDYVLLREDLGNLQEAVALFDSLRRADFGQNISESTVGVVDLACMIELNGATHRYNIKEMLQKGQAKGSKRVAKQIERIPSLLWRVMQPECITYTEGTVKNNAEVAHRFLSTVLTMEFNEHARLARSMYDYDSGMVEAQAKLADGGAQLMFLSVMFSLLPTIEKVGDIANATITLGSEDKQRLEHMRQGALQSKRLYEMAGKLHFRNRDYARAAQSFDKAMRWGTTSLASASGDADDEVALAPCALLYWKAQALAAQDGFLDSEQSADAVLRALEEAIRCQEAGSGAGSDAASSTMVRQALAQRSRLLEFVENFASEAYW